MTLHGVLVSWDKARIRWSGMEADEPKSVTPARLRRGNRLNVSR